MCIRYFTNIIYQYLHSSEGACNIVLMAETTVPQKHQQQSGSGVLFTFNTLSVASRWMLLVAGEAMGIGCLVLALAKMSRLWFGDARDRTHDLLTVTRTLTTTPQQ